MNITEIRVKMIGNNAERLKAFCSITLDGDFVIRDLKVIDGVSGFFVAMPSRKLSDRCQKCGSKNHLRARFCNDCGAKLDDSRADRDVQGRAKLHADVAHPINATCRERLQQAVIEAFEEELGKSKEPGYEPAVYDDDEAIEEKTHEAPQPEPSKHETADADVSNDDEGISDEDGDDFESLIAGLKQDAAARRAKRDGDSDDRRDQRRPPRREERRAPAASIPDEPAEPQETDDFLAGLEDPEQKPESSRPAASSPPVVESQPEPVQVQPAAAPSESPSAADQDEQDDDGFSDGLL